MSIESLAAYQHVVSRLHERWPAFLAKREKRLAEQRRFGHAAEQATEGILEDLFTEVLDWSVADVNHQVGCADLLLSQLGVKYLIIEAKRPGGLAWNEAAVRAALDQACRYADEQRVRVVAISDGVMLYGADIVNGGHRDRVFVSLVADAAPEALWWLSVHGIYRERADVSDAAIQAISTTDGEVAAGPADGSLELLHHKYRLPARCFAYVGDASRPTTWKLPFRCANGIPDHERLPKAIQAILSNYRGMKVGSVPETAIPDVLQRLAAAARELGRMPGQCADPAAVYLRLDQTLEQFSDH